MNTFKQQISQHLSEQQLSHEQLAALHELQQRTPVTAAPKRRRFITMSIAASLAGLVFISLLFQPWLRDNDMLQSIAEEVVMNHFKRNPLEVTGQELATVSRYFTKLDFNIINSAQLPAIDDQLMGGRYCSIQGITAAQLRLTDPRHDDIRTLYQTRYDSDTFGDAIPNIDTGENPAIVYARGIKVSIWREKGVLFALTQKAD